MDHSFGMEKLSPIILVADVSISLHLSGLSFVCGVTYGTR